MSDVRHSPLRRPRRLAEQAGTQVAAADYLESTVIGLVDTAPAAPNAVLAAASLGLGSVFVGAIRNRRRYGLTGGWTDRVLTRLRGPESMAGRRVLRQALERRGLPSR